MERQTATSPLGQHVPVVLLKLWSRSLGALAEMISGWRLSPDEVLTLGPGLYAFLPSAGQAELVEAAHFFCQRVFLSGPAGSKISALILPGTVQGDTRGYRASDRLLDDIEAAPPELEDRVVYLTGHAVWELEGGWKTQGHDRYRGPSGRSCTLLTLAEPQPRSAPWRNAELLGSTTRAIDRAIYTTLEELSKEPALAIRGAFGTGKTRAAFEAVRPPGTVPVWLRAWGSRSGGPSLAKSLARALIRLRLLEPGILSRLEAAAPGALHRWWHAESEQQLASLSVAVAAALDELPNGRKLTLFVDDLHKARPVDLAFIEHLLDHSGLGTSFRLVALGRSRSRWLRRLDSLPTAEVGPLPVEEAEVLWHQLIGGLSMPTAVQSRFLESGAGFPLALEDGLLQLVRRRHLRQLYGNFFYSGPADVEVEATARLVRHLDSEVRRLGNPLPLLVLACADSPLPEATLTLVAKGFGVDLDQDWAAPYVEGGLLTETPSSFGSAVTFSCPTFLLALRSTVVEESVADLRRRIAEGLARAGDEPQGAWERYELQAGAPEAIPALLQAVRRATSGDESLLLFQAVRSELENHSQRDGDSETELELLWALLPLARRLGKLRNLETAIDRALELAASDTKKRLALITLKAEHSQNAGRLKEAETCLVEGLQIAQGASPLRQSLLLIQLGKLLHRQERFAEARKLFEDFLPNVDQEGNPALAATCRYHLGNIALREHKLKQALDYHQKALRLRQDHQLNQHLGSSLAAMGSLNLAFGNYPRALRLFNESLEVLDEHGSAGETSFALLGIGRAMSRLGDYLGASQPFRQALELRDGSDDQTGEALARLEIAENQLSLGHLEGCLQETRKAHFKLILLEATKYIGDAERLLGQAYLKQRQYEQAADHFRAAFERHQRRGHLLESTFDRAWLLEASLALEDVMEIERLTGELLRVMNFIDYPELGEQIDLRIYRGLRWLASRSQQPTDPSEPLERAYNEICRKTELLDVELRNRFLFQIPDNRAIVDAATMHGLALRSLADDI